MGIPYYFYTLYKKYANAKLMVSEREIAEKKVDHLFLDYNSMIHPCAQQVLLALGTDGLERENEYIEAAIIQNTMAYTRYIIGLLHPGNVYIMIDGVAPRAKINQQRERRYKSYFLKKLASSEGTVQWDSNKITPGTWFMRSLRKALDILKLECARIHDTNIFISDSDECGEGEHKMMKYISGTLKESKDNIYIYGLDSDLIMLSLMNIARDNIILIRDNTFNDKLKECDRTFTYLDVQQLGAAIYQELSSLYKEQSSSKGLCHTTQTFIKDRLIDDYIFLCFMLGNDFVEHLPSLMIRQNGVNVITRCYVSVLAKFETYLIDKMRPLQERVNIHMYVDILAQLSSCEDYFFKKIYSAYKGEGIVYKDIPIDDAQANINSGVHLFRQDVIRYNEDGYKQRYYKYYGILDVEAACKDYIEGLYWIDGYYNNHEHTNWSWHYKHHAVPFVSDLYSFLRSNVKWMSDIIYKTDSLNPSNPNSTLQQLCMVLPRESLIVILEEIGNAKDESQFLGTRPNTTDGAQKISKVKRILRTNSDTLERYYPTHITLDLIHREWLWQSKVFFDNLDNENIDLIF